MFDETLQSDESCLWFDEFDDDQEPFSDEDDADEDDDHEDEEEEFGPKVIEYRCSPVCRFSPTVRMLIERLSDQFNELLNVFGGALNESVYVYAPYAPYRFTSRRERIYYGRHLMALGEIEAVRDELRAERDRLEADLLSVTGGSPRAEFQRVEHHLRDYRILVALAGCHHEYVFHWWDTTLMRFLRSEMLRKFYRARDAMRARDPVERKAARMRDAKRRKTRHRKEYLAAYEAMPEVRALRAERKRAARAAARAQRGDQAEIGIGAATPTNIAADAPHVLLAGEASGAMDEEPDCLEANGSVEVCSADDVQAA